MISLRRKDAWTSEQDQMVIDLRNQFLGWKEVARQIGRTVESVTARYRTILPPEQRQRFLTSKRWLKQDMDTLNQLVSEKKTPAEIAKILGRGVSTIYSKLQYTAKLGTKIHTQLVPRVHAPPERLADRDRRMAAERTITAFLCGDPAPGQSALDRRTI